MDVTHMLQQLENTKSEQKECVTTVVGGWGVVQLESVIHMQQGDFVTVF